jgi:hypothetical protein
LAAEVPNPNLLRWQTIEKAALSLPDKNPDADPDFLMSYSSFQIILSLRNCDYDTSDMRVIDELVDIFEKAKKLPSGNYAYIQAELLKIKELPESDRKTIERSAYFFPSMTEAGIQNTSCRGQVKMLFSEGAQRSDLLTVIHTEMTKLQVPITAAPAPTH